MKTEAGTGAMWPWPLEARGGKEWVRPGGSEVLDSSPVTLISGSRPSELRGDALLLLRATRFVTTATRN